MKRAWRIAAVHDMACSCSPVELVEEAVGRRKSAHRYSARRSGGMIGFGFLIEAGGGSDFDRRMKNVRRCRRWMLVGWADADADAGIWTGRRWVGPGIGVVGLAMLGGAAGVHVHIGFGFGGSSPGRRRTVVVGVRSGV